MIEGRRIVQGRKKRGLFFELTKGSLTSAVVAGGAKGLLIGSSGGVELEKNYKSRNNLHQNIDG